MPTKAKQIEAVAKFLDSERNEGRSLKEIATEIVNGYLEAITPPPPGINLREGMLIKTAVAGRVYRIAWMDDPLVWIVGETASYGWLGRTSDDLWAHSEEFRPKKRVQVDGKNKMVEMSDEDIEEDWSNPDFKPGDRLSQHQREFKFEVIATGPTCALLRNLSTDALVSDSTANLKKHYKREAGDTSW